MGGKTSAAVKNRYIQKAYDRINFVMPKGRKAEIQECAQQEGINASEWINNAIIEKMDGKVSCASFDFCTNIPDLDAYARCVGLTPEEYVKTAVVEKMERQDQEFSEDITRERLEE